MMVSLKGEGSNTCRYDLKLNLSLMFERAPAALLTEILTGIEGTTSK